MWVLIFWMASPFSASTNHAKQPTLAIHTQAFFTERACKDAFSAITRANVGEMVLRGVCVPKGEEQK